MTHRYGDRLLPFLERVRVSEEDDLPLLEQVAKREFGEAPSAAEAAGYVKLVERRYYLTDRGAAHLRALGGEG